LPNCAARAISTLVSSGFAKYLSSILNPPHFCLHRVDCHPKPVPYSPSSRVSLLANILYRKLEYALYGIVLVVSAGVAIVTERLDFHLQEQVLTADIAKFNQDFAHRLDAEISQLVASANGLSAAVALNAEIDENQFTDAALHLGTNNAIVRSISLATDGIVRQFYPGAQSSEMIGRDLRTLPNHIEGLELARQTGRPVLAGPMDLLSGGRGLILRVAFAPGLEDGGPSARRQMISIVVDSAAFFEQQAPSLKQTNILTAVSAGNNETVIWGNPATFGLRPIVSKLVTPSDIWQIASAPTGGWPTVSTRAPAIAGFAFLRTLIVCAVIRAILGLLRRQKVAERQLSDAIEALDDGFALFDPMDRLSISNSRYRQIYKTSVDLLAPGATFESIIRGGVQRGQYPDAIGREEEWIRRRLAAHRAGGSVIEQQLDDGRWLRVVERRTLDGSVVGFRVDITELKAATDAARAAEQAKSDFIAVLSHELRTPLTVTMGYVSMLLEASSLPAVMKLRQSIASAGSPQADVDLQTVIATIEDMAAKAHRSSLQHLSLMNHLLDFSKIEAGKMQLDRVDLDAAKILAEIESAYREHVEAKGLTFLVSSVPSRISADPIRLQQVLMNLVSNSLKFTDTGEIQVQSTIKNGMAHFVVRDTGCGIPAELIDRLFKPFEQADNSTKRRAGGTGLGLAISKNLVEMMGGTIGFESNVQSGSLFWFTMPLAKS
jgi:two-component system cell cycle sensor histidine kinase PleC